LLKSLDLAKILEDPEFLPTISREFIEQHFDEIAEGIRMGEAFAKAVIDEKTRRDNV